MTRACSADRPYWRTKRSALAAKSSGSTRESSISSVMTTEGTSVSGYMRADPGRGRMYSEQPSASARRVSSGTNDSASRARICTADMAFSALSRGPVTMIRASPSPAAKARRKASTSPAVTP